jgi:hypothetical protein
MRDRAVRLFLGLAAAGLLSMALSGCAVIRKEYGRPVPETGRFVDGQTHYRDVLEELGPPAKLSAMDEGMVFLYERAALTEKQLGIDIDYEKIPILKIVFARGKVEGETATLLFDGEGTLISHDWETWNRDLGKGQSVQLFISVMSVTSPGGYDQAPVNNFWGAQLLTSRLPNALNRGSNLDTGQSGVEVKGTPDGAGQHSLELRPALQR